MRETFLGFISFLPYSAHRIKFHIETHSRLESNSPNRSKSFDSIWLSRDFKSSKALFKIHDRSCPMDSSVQNSPIIDEDEWDTDGFVIPSLGIEDQTQTTTNPPQVDDSKHTIKAEKEEHIYLGPHGAPPSQTKQDVNSSGRKQRFKQKLKDADQRISGSGRENKMENLRDLVGGGKTTVNPSRSSARDWLDPHCHESQFERR